MNDHTTIPILSCTRETSHKTGIGMYGKTEVDGTGTNTRPHLTMADDCLNEETTKLVIEQ